MLCHNFLIWTLLFSAYGGAEEFCDKYYLGVPNLKVKCDNYCCGQYSSRYCCNDCTKSFSLSGSCVVISSTTTVVNIGFIVGVVLAAIFGLSIIIGIIICVFTCGCTNSCKTTPSMRGRVDPLPVMYSTTQNDRIQVQQPIKPPPYPENLYPPSYPGIQDPPSYSGIQYPPNYPAIQETPLHPPPDYSSFNYPSTSTQPSNYPPQQSLQSFPSSIPAMVSATPIN